MSVPNSIKLAVQAMALQAMAAVQIFPTWAGTVKSQNANGSLEWAPDATGFLSGLSNVPIRAPLPGWQYTVPANTRVGVVFENGDRQRPAAVLFDPTVGQAITLTINTSQAITLNTQMTNVGGNPAAEPMLMGQQILNLLNSLYTELIAHTHIGNLGAPTPLSPADIAILTAQQALVTAAPPANTLVSNVGVISHDQAP